MSAIQQVYETVKKENISMGEAMVQKQFIDVVINHILKHFYGFEFMVAPYAVAHLKLTLLLEELGFNFSMTAKDDDPDNDRVKVYLANTLDDPSHHGDQAQATTDFGSIAFPSIPDESEKARQIKKDFPILVILGNPPYANFGKMNKSEWIITFLKDYKRGLNEKKINIDDDYIKFIRFAQWKIEQNGVGVIAMITNNSFVDGITHRKMRESLLKTFNDIYVANLHGNIRKNEMCPGGERDENVFSIMQGVSVNVFVKYRIDDKPCKIHYKDIYGKRTDKYEWLNNSSVPAMDCKIIEPKSPNYFFGFCKDEKVVGEYRKYISITDVFDIYSVGIGTKVDAISTDFEKSKLSQRIAEILANRCSLEVVIEKYGLDNKTTWEYDRALRASFSDEKIVDYDYRPFDSRYVYYDKDFLSRNRSEVMDNFYNQDNLGIELGRTSFCAFISSKISDEHFGGAKSYKFPLYIKANKQIEIGSTSYYVNIKDEFMRKIENVANPEEVLYYAYAVFYCPTYRSRYAEQLIIDFPRLPVTKDKKLFADLVKKGKELVNLHLLGKNPFDKSPTIFDDNSKWNVQIGGEKPDNLDDWKVKEVRYDAANKRVYVNPGQYFEGVEKVVWEFMIGGYQVCEKWLKDRKKAERCLSTEDLKHYMKIVVSLRETIRVMGEIDKLITKWPME